MSAFKFQHSLRDDEARHANKIYWPLQQIQLIEKLIEQHNTIIELLKMSVLINGPYTGNENINNFQDFNNKPRTNVQNQDLVEESDKKPNLWERYKTEVTTGKTGRFLDKIQNGLNFLNSKRYAC
jgi:hypothetical protein